MNVSHFLVAFHPRKRGLGLFGHVELVMVSEDGTHAFLNPSWHGADIEIEHRFDVINAFLGLLSDSADILLYTPTNQTSPSIGPLMTCASIVGHLVGIRAFTPAGLRRKLLRNGAKVINHAGSIGISSLET